MLPSTTRAEPVASRCGHLDSSPRIDDRMRHDDPTINSILEADPELNELRGAWFESLIDFFSDFENGGTRTSLNSATRNVMNRASTYNGARTVVVNVGASHGLLSQRPHLRAGVLRGRILRACRTQSV